MKMNRFFYGIVFATVLLPLFCFAATVITNNSAIGALDTSYDGADIVISNCMVTVDGAHSFNSIYVGPAGTLTHSWWPTGTPAPTVSVTNEVQILDASFPATLLNTNVIGLVSVVDTNTLVTYSNGVDYIQTNLSDGTMQIYATTNSSIPGYAVVWVSYTWSYSYASGLNLTVTNDLTVANGGAVTVNGIGYGGGYGMGLGLSSGGPYYDGSGGGHGGGGGMSLSNAVGGSCYGSLYHPVTLGSGGGRSYAGTGGSGGGKIQISAGGNVTIDGVISANGMDATNSRAGGGAGGSIWITATNVNGAGSITANGGAGAAGHGGGGGGGHISIQCGTNNFSGNITAYGGGGWSYGGAGTVYTETNGQTGLLVLDNGGHPGTNSTVSLTNMVDAVCVGGAVMGLSGGGNFHDLTIATNSTVTGSLANNLLNVTVTGNLTIQAGGALSMNSLGSAPGVGQSPGTYSTLNVSYPCGGGAHGGNGGAGYIGGVNAAGGTGYDSQVAPTYVGSGGGNYLTSIGGYGGGALYLSVSGNLVVDGAISANGGNGSGTGGGGGAGGTIYIQGNPQISGAGSISANGGNGAGTIGGGGAGGRISISAKQNNFTVAISAVGGSGANYGGAGTILFNSVTWGVTQQLTVDNGGHIGANTVVSSASSANLTVQNGGMVTANNSVTFAGLLVASNGWLIAYGPNSTESFTISGNATFQAGGGFMADSGGYTSGSGASPGGYSASYPYACGGGGHGGAGGNSVSNSAGGGAISSDYVTSPAYYYNGGGGGGYSSYSIGGTGGGYVRMTVGGTFQLDGIISANGGNGAGLGGGGGSGGGVYLTTGSFTGHGSVSANGGTGANNNGGGGGGGMVAIYFNNNSFTGSLSAFGGGGANWGGAGTIYMKTNSASRGQLILDNGGHIGASSASQVSSVDLTLLNGSRSYISGSASFGNLTVGSNAWLVVSNRFTSPSSTTISAVNVTVQPGGSITADMTGYTANNGGGRGTYWSSSPTYPCSGAGHGGYGANCVSNMAAGGTVYDNYNIANTAGSGGGGISSSFGGNGGGVIQMTLSGNLQVNGVLSANGGNGYGTGGGGGSGGAINISCSSLTGSGTISANGGAGVDGIGGGGGGGMIAASFTSNLFTGVISAYGGGGAYYAGAGMIYLKTNTTSQSVCIVDNGGHRGTNTLVAANSSQNGLVLRNGGTAIQNLSSQVYSSLLIGSNSWLFCNLIGSSLGTINFTTTGNTTIQAGGGISADGAGYTQNQGAGYGTGSSTSPWYAGSGAGHGGYGGGAGASSFVPGGTTYDSIASAGMFGSGGGGFAANSIGGRGGGVVNLHVNGTLQMDGGISANGINGSGAGGGGGSGGYVYLSVGSLAGAGNISANGGNGANMMGGGGGGGRIAIINTLATNSFTGTVTAYGGGGSAYGGAGTVYYGPFGQKPALLVLDNGNNAGTNTTFDLNNMDVIIQGAAVGVLPSSFSWSLNNLTIRTNSTLTAQIYAGSRSIMANNVTVDAGGALQVDGQGYNPQTGPGSGYASSGIRGGGGHGGCGGGDALNGSAYDSVLAPATSGSGGATYYYSGVYNYGGYGGGALTLTANGNLTVNGRLSANGGNGAYNAGGGAGGSLYLSSINKLAGSGVISANGGSFGGGSAGGGGGGRIALMCNSNVFTGRVSACGGNGLFPGGAGSVYSSIAGTRTLTMDNGGFAGTNTPLNGYTLPPSPFDLNISGGAVVTLPSNPPLLGNLNLGAGSTLGVASNQTSLVLAIQTNANIAGNLIVDNRGYALGSGAGHGQSISNDGAGGGYGGAGGNSSSGAAGGITYGSSTQPTDFGSGGGNGVNTVAGGSEGGGALRLTVGGILNVDGNVSADGDFGWQDNSGGGSGGSVWISANTLTGAGNISAQGGDGAPVGGGGGGGGRVAIYAPINLFTGITNADGGSGVNNGQPGSIFYSSTLGSFDIISQSPTGTVASVVSSIDLTFNEAIDPASVSGAAFTLASPAGSVSGISASASGANTVHMTFPVQNTPGNYVLQAAPTLTNILGVPLTQTYSGGFSISLPTISGTVSDTNGAPVAGVTVQPDGGLPATMTDGNGNYSIGVASGWNGTITPGFGTSMFVPGILTYTNVTASLTGQNYLMVPTIAPGVTFGGGGTNLSLTWTGISNVTYQVWSSTNLVDWVPYGNSIPGTNGMLEVDLPVDPAALQTFFRIGAAN